MPGLRPHPRSRAAAVWMHSRCSSLGAQHAMAGMSSGRQADDEAGAGPVHVVVALQFTAVLANDAVADTQPEPGSLAHIFSGVERIEDTFGMRYPWAAIDKRDLHGICVMPAMDLDAPALGGFPDRVISVVQDVEEDLLQLMAIAKYRGC